MEFKLLVWKVGLLCIFSQHPVVQAQIAPSCSEYVKQYYANPSTYYTTGTVYCGGWQRREVSYQCPKTTCSEGSNRNSERLLFTDHYAASRMCKL
ncbi:uncharacterized protein LOC126568616 isoform X2 [Anopheles maculipalpis]|uniref:uncharacterized protein LOC126568616 isoform X2 n=1 Tax=Anopheles maculipalpis TaxID=1496333 RepID=UPI0021590E0D|nr:uncharacterized protein LOC126568616 isoform X2 [Anopheles maculipalpis]